MKSVNMVAQKKERGQSLPELAISLVMLLMLLLGAFDFGRAFFTWMSLRDVAQEGASGGSIFSGNQCNEALKRAHNDNSITGTVPVVRNNITVSCTIIPHCSSCAVPGKTEAGDTIQVTATYNNFPLTAPFLGTIIGTQYLTINATIKDTLLVPGCY